MSPGTVLSVLKVVAELGVVVAKSVAAKDTKPEARVDELWAECKSRIAADRVRARLKARADK